MSPEKRITKRHMKEDKLVSTALKTSEYIQNNKTYFIGGLAAIIAIGLAIYYFNYSIAQKDYHANELFGKAQLAAAMQQPVLAINDYKIILTEFGSTSIADRACYYLGKTYYSQENCDSAIFYFDRYINKFGKENILLGAAYSGAANCYEDRNDFAKAGEYYFNAAELSDDELNSPGYYMAAGRAFSEAEQYENAVKAYQQIIDKFSRNAKASSAKEKLAEVKYKIK